MSIKLLIKDAILIAQGLSELSKLPATVAGSNAAYWLGRIRTALQEPLTQYEKSRTELIKEHGELDEKTGNYIVGPEAIKTYSELHDGLLDIEVEVPYNPVKAADLFSQKEDKQVEFSPESLFKLDKVLDHSGMIQK